MKVFNFRPLFIIFISLIIGIFLSMNYFMSGNYNFYILVLLIFVFSLIAIFITKMKWENLKNSKLCIASILVVLSLLISFGYTSLKFNKLDEIKYYGDYVSITGRVNSITQGDNYTSLQLGDISIYCGGVKEETNYNILVYMQDYEPNSLQKGSLVTFECLLEKVNVFKNDEPNSKLLNKNIAYTTYVNYADILSSFGEMNIFEKISSYGYDILSNTFQDEEFGVCIAVLFGDSTYLESDSYDLFKNSGVAHILAVSGLHITMLGYIIWLIVDKLKISVSIKFGILIAFLTFYCALCSFTSSVVRASIMFVCLMLGKKFGERNDLLSSLSLAGIIILLINPFSLFSKSFILSFGSVFGIAVVFPYVERALLKINLPSFLASAIAITISTTLATLPFALWFFGSIPVMTILANVVVLPLFTIFYYLLVITSLLSFALNFLSFLLFLPKVVLSLIMVLVKFFSSYGLITLSAMSFSNALSYEISLFMTSDYVLINKKYKLIFAILVVSIIAMCV